MRVLMMLLMFLGAVLADYDRDSREYGHGYEKDMHIPRDLGFLDLSESQEAALRKILSENTRRLEELHEESEREEKRFRELFLQEEFDKTRFEKEYMRLKMEAIRVEVEMLSRIHAVLTPKQREKFVEYLEEWELE